MARCPNKNTAEYKALQAVYTTELATNNIINSWQDLNNTDVFPTVIEAETFVKTNKVAFALTQKEFGESLLNNLRREKIIHQYQNVYLVNNSNPETREYDETFLQNNLDRLTKYLEINNIPLDSVSITRTPMSYRVEVKSDLFTPKDMLPGSRSWDTNRSRAVVMHLMKMFPQIKVAMLSVSEAQTLYDTLPQWKKTTANFSEVNSFYVDGIAYLIRGRVTDETAIEEMLHPFIDAIKVDNPELFNGLLAEAKKNFPELTQEITNAYNKNRNFTQLERDLEIVTQTLTRYFKNEYENNPTQSFLNRIQEALEWFMNIIKDLGNYITGRTLPVTAINSKTTFSDLAKLLNTEGIRFELKSAANAKIRYSLTPELQKTLDAALGQANPLQKEMIRRMFHSAISDKETVESLSANYNAAAEGNDIVVLNKKDHTYYNITTGEEYLSTTTAIKGKLKNEEDVQLNLDLGNDLDALLDALVSYQPLESVVDKMKVLNLEQATKMYTSLENNLRPFRPSGSVALSQVVVFDTATKLAGTADLIIIDPQGRIQVIDLKTSKNSIHAKSLKDYGNVSYETREWTLPEDSLLKQAGVNKLSTAGQHNLQVNMYTRMFENMGYTISNTNAITIHYLSYITGKGKDQKFNGNLKRDGYFQHPASTERNSNLNKLIPLVKDNLNKKEFDDQPYVGREDEKVNSEKTVSAKETTENVEYPEYNTIFTALYAEKGFMKALLAKQKAIDLIDSKIYLKQGEKLTRDEISSAVALMSMNMGAGSAARAQTYTAMLRYGLREMQEFNDYVSDPKNVNSPEYIRYVMNFKRFLGTYESLYVIGESSELNATQKSLVGQMQIQYNKLIGTENTEGIINQAVIDFVTEQVRLRSNRNFGAENSKFTEDDLKEIIHGGGVEFSRDIDITELMTKDMATSGDTLLSVMDKIYKRQKQIVLDKIAYREAIIRKASEKLIKLSSTSDKNKIFDFMREFDEDGNPTAFYTKIIGQQYFQMQNDLYSEFSDDNGTPYEYVPIKNLENATPEQIAYNIDLADKKKAYSEFMKAESSDKDDYQDGTYHKYTQEFKDARNKFEYFKDGYWLLKNSSNSPMEIAAYRAKYYETNIYTKALRINGVATGAVVENQEYTNAVKKQYVEAREISADGKDMRSKKYKELYDPAKTDALTLAQREFYELYIQYYEKELLLKLPEQVRFQMLGRIPLVKNEVVSSLKKEGSVFTNMYANTVRNWKNLTETTASEKTLATDENGNFYSGLPIFLTGSPSVDNALETIEADINALKDDYKKNKLTKGKYKEDLALLNGKAQQLRNRPSVGELSGDMGGNLLKFSAMAEHYEVMGEIEDTLNAFVKIIENKTYNLSSTKDTIVSKTLKGVASAAGYSKKTTGLQSNVEKRARKYMSMVFYDNELVTKGVANKLADILIEASSLTYVAFNPLGNFNNYLMGRINNNIEMLGSRYFTKKNYLRASKEYNSQGLQSGIFQRLGAAAVDIADIATLGKAGLKASTYDPDYANNLYEALVEDLRMMDNLSDIRESSRDNDGKTIWQRFKEWGYVMQDAAEYNVQTKVGMAMLMDITVKNSTTGETLSYYDAHVFNPETHKPELKKGYDTIVTNDGNEKPLDQDFKYEITNNIREVNKQIHGNYAKDDRMVMQSYVLGNMAAQFKKWVAPAIRSRFQRAYFDENLGHMEGRYRSWWRFMGHVKEQIFKGNRDFSKMKEEFLKEQGFVGKGGNRDQFATNQLLGFYRTTGELGIIMAIMAMNLVLDSVLLGDDDDDPAIRRLKNALKKQGQRLEQETTAFTPLSMGLQLFGMIESPIAATKNIENMVEALGMTIFTPYGLITQSQSEFYANSTYVYQRGRKKGELKLWKEWKDAIPILYTIQKWDNLIEEQQYSIKY